MLFPSATWAAPQSAGSIRGTVYDKDFDIPLAAATVVIVETNQKALTGDQGHFVLAAVPAGKYTLLFSKEGYIRQVRSDVVVAAGQLTDVSVALAGEFTEMDELVVQDVLQGGAGAEAALLSLRFESASLMDSISSDLMSRAGASDAAKALSLVSGVSVQDGKFAVIRGLPDRYVSSQMNGVRLPSADEDTRAVELDQFPAVVIESIQVSKTFTPDQQGDASGGAVDVRLKGIPTEPILQSKLQFSANSNVAGSDFLTYDGGGVNTWGDDDGGRDIQTESIGQAWKGAAGVTTGDAPLDFKWSGAYGAKHESDDGFKFGGLASLFYERDSEYYDDGINDSWWVLDASNPSLSPETIQGIPDPSGTGGSFKTALFDVTQGSQSVKWGGLGTLGLETRDHSIGLTALYTRVAEDTATLAVDTRGKEYFFPGHDPDDPNSPGNASNDAFGAPYLRLETLDYTERTTATLQLNGKHALPIDAFKLGSFEFRKPELDWTVSRSFAGFYQPDKRFFAAYWTPEAPGVPHQWWGYQPSHLFTLGNFQRVWKEISEDSEQYSLNLKFPFQQWSDREGYAKVGVFHDRVDRSYDQDSFSNFSDLTPTPTTDFDEPWSDIFPTEPTHLITAAETDIDYDGAQDIGAWYAMIDLPLSSKWSAVGGLRFESTEISIVNHPETFATWVSPGGTGQEDLDGDEADVEFEQDDVLPSIGFVYEATEQITFRGAFSETVARQTFKELTPSIQQEYLGAPIFLGNPELQMSALENYDLRADYSPYDGGLVSLSAFYKDIEDPIEYVQRIGSFSYTTPVNYPQGELYGVELEVRQRLEKVADSLEGLSLGANATMIESEVDLPPQEVAGFASIGVPATSRDMTNAPEYLYNLFLTYDLRPTNTQLGLFYTVQGDTLVAGGQPIGALVDFVPDVYAEDYDTLNFTVSQRFGKYVKLDFQAKNLTNPKIKEVYRSDIIGGDVTRTSYTKGVEFSLAFGVEFAF